jgi:recombination protein RecA
VKEEERQRGIRLKLARMETPAGASIPTGFAALDSAVGVGGLPRGGIVELFGPSSSGKTTLALEIIAHLQKMGDTAAWIDADHTFDATYADTLGVAIEGLPLAQPDSAEEALEIARQLAASNAVDLLVIDSAAALVPSVELETGIGDGGQGLHSRVLASGLRKLARVVSKTGTAVLVLNQTRTRPEADGGESETSAGGPPLKLYAAVRIALSRADARRVSFRILKNKVAAPFTEGELEWRQGSGVAESL